MKIIVEKDLDKDRFWATPEEFAKMTDKDVIDMLHEDLYAFMENAVIKVDRSTK